MEADESKPILDYDKQVSYYTANSNGDSNHFEKNSSPNPQHNSVKETTVRRVNTAIKINCEC